MSATYQAGSLMREKYQNGARNIGIRKNGPTANLNANCVPDCKNMLENLELAIEIKSNKIYRIKWNEL